jgi:hypothetical protein
MCRASHILPSSLSSNSRSSLSPHSWFKVSLLRTHRVPNCGRRPTAGTTGEAFHKVSFSDALFDAFNMELKVRDIDLIQGFGHHRNIIAVDEKHALKSALITFLFFLLSLHPCPYSLLDEHRLFCPYALLYCILLIQS